MSGTIYQFLSWAVHDVVFFSGDVQTTTIAFAITSSLCFSIIFAVIHVLNRVTVCQDKGQEVKKSAYRVEFTASQPNKQKPFHAVVVSCGKELDVPCVKCGSYYADNGCRFVTCKHCCFSISTCHVHQNKDLHSRSCETSQQLTDLDLSKCSMGSCPKRLGFVGAQLTCLNLSDNSLHAVPPEIGCLRGLVKLSLRGNYLMYLPKTLVSLTKLKKFDISHNKFSECPECIGHLSSLECLDLSHNKLKCLPCDIGGLRILRKLNIESNDIDNLAEELFTLIKLKCLCVSDNPISSLPDSVGNLVKLTELDAQSCDLASLPAAIGKCSSISCLYLSYNRLTSLPSQIGQLYRLQKLCVEYNKLSYLPATVQFLPDSLVISVSGNPLLAEDSVQCDSLTTPFPEGFPSLKELSARFVAQQNIPCTDILPRSLQDMLAVPSYCTTCGSPFFSFYEGRILFHSFPFGNPDWLPVYRQLCSQHHTGNNE